VGQEFLVDAYASPGRAWICLEVGGVNRRVLIPVPAAATPGVGSHVDAPPPPLPDPRPARAGLPSSRCQTLGGANATRVANMTSGGVSIWAYTWSPSPGKLDICTRLEGPVSAGGVLEIEPAELTDSLPSVSRDEAVDACGNPVLDLTTPVDAHLATTRVRPAQTPPAVCLTLGGTKVRLYVGTDMDDQTLPVTWTPDPGGP
jgi:hypothetical protein